MNSCLYLVISTIIIKRDGRDTISTQFNCLKNASIYYSYLENASIYYSYLEKTSLQM